MTVIRVTSNAEELLGDMRHIFEDQLPFATSLALNNTAKDFQARQREHQRAAFTIRRPSFFNRAVKISEFSNKRRLSVEIKIDPPGGQSRADIITRHEADGTRTPFGGGKRLAVPAAVRRTKTGFVGKSQRPKAFAFRKVGEGPGVEVYAGRRRTFMIKRSDGTGGIFRRTGRRRTGRRLASDLGSRGVRDLNVDTLYRFTPQAHIDARLSFEANAEGVFQARFERNFQAAFDRAIGLNVGKKQARRIAGADVLGRDRARG